MTTTQNTKAPGEIFSDEDMGGVIAFRIDGPADTRGKAQAFFAREWDIEFTAAKVRKTYYRQDPDYIAEHIEDGIAEPYDGWPWFECSRALGTAAYWTLTEDARP